MSEQIVHRKYRLGMTREERANHVPGTGIEVGPQGTSTNLHLNLTRSLADVYEIRRSFNGHTNLFQWIERP